MTSTTFPVGNLPSVLEHVGAADPDGVLVPCRISSIRLGRGRLAEVVDAVGELVGDTARPRVSLIVDATPIMRGGVDVKAEVERRLGEKFEVHTEVLTDEHPVLHADERAIETAGRAAQGASAVVTVGGGTITDIGKLASIQAGGTPLITIQTAASVDGFTDNVSVILSSGVKRTVPSRWPDVVISDVETITEAPPAMNRAGFGEITSLFTATADWRLAQLLGFDPSFHEAPVQLLESVAADIGEWSPGVAVADVDAVERLTWALAVRGIATGISGTTAVLSGAEHLVSHMLDLHHGELHLPMGLHGAQVGVASVLAAAAWEVLFDRMSTGVPVVHTPDPEQAEAQIVTAFAHLDPTGRIAAECWRDYRVKLESWSTRREHVERVLADWPAVATQLRGLVRPAADIARALQAAGCPARPVDLEPVIPVELARWALANCSLMRNRFTVVDLLTFLGWWLPQDVEEVRRRAEVAAEVSS